MIGFFDMDLAELSERHPESIPPVRPCGSGGVAWEALSEADRKTAREEFAMGELDEAIAKRIGWSGSWQR